MPKRLETRIWRTEGGSYLFSDVEENDELTRKLKPDTPEYYSWLAGLKSFHFEGEHGRFTARLDKRAGKSYWTAYRKANHKQLRQYLGTTRKLSIAALETTAQHLTEKIADQEPKTKVLRRKAEKREILYARIKARDEALKKKDEEIEALKKQLKESQDNLARQVTRTQKLENQLSTKRL